MLSDGVWCMHTKMPVNLVFVINFIAPNKLVNASDEGLSDDRCDPTKTTGNRQIL